VTEPVAAIILGALLCGIGLTLIVMGAGALMPNP
jgi:hypothetical protein